MKNDKEDIISFSKDFVCKVDDPPSVEDLKRRIMDRGDKESNQLTSYLT